MAAVGGGRQRQLQGTAVHGGVWRLSSSLPRLLTFPLSLTVSPSPLYPFSFFFPFSFFHFPFFSCPFLSRFFHTKVTNDTSLTHPLSLSLTRATFVQKYTLTKANNGALMVGWLRCDNKYHIGQNWVSQINWSDIWYFLSPVNQMLPWCLLFTPKWCHHSPLVASICVPDYFVF